MLRLLQRVLTIMVLAFAGLFLAYQGLMFYQAQDKMPPGTLIAGVDVTGLTAVEAKDAVLEVYYAPIQLEHRDQQIPLNPAEAGFVLDVDRMVATADALRTPEEPALAFLEFVIGRSFEPVVVDLVATHDRALLQQHLEMLASFLDKPATGPRFVQQTESFVMGEDGYVTDVDTSLPVVEAALYSPNDRVVTLAVVDEAARPFDISLLHDLVQEEIEGFAGMGSIFIMDLKTGEEVSINADVALSGLSVVKIAILLETYRVIDNEPDIDQRKLIDETAINSGNYSANLLLDVVAGQDNAYLGVDILTESMKRLGLVNTFIVTPYEEPNRPDKTTLTTPANSRVDINTYPDPTMQTTAEDMGTLLSMIYYCSEGGGTLLAVYQGEITPEECQAILDVMALNTEGNLIRFGVPEGVQVSHKHGWAGNTHGDAGIVFSEGGDYVIVEYLTDPETDWLLHDTSFPILREISRTVYNFFNRDNPYFGNRLVEEEPTTGAEVGAPGSDEVEATPDADTATPEATEEAPPADGEPTPEPTPSAPGIEA